MGICEDGAFDISMGLSGGNLNVIGPQGDFYLLFSALSISNPSGPASDGFSVRLKVHSRVIPAAPEKISRER